MLHRNTFGHVYLAKNKAMPSLIKIGATSIDPNLRLKDLSNTSVPFKFEFIALYQSNDCLEFEQLVHKQLQNRNVGKEFFRISKDKAIKEIDKLCDIYKKGAWRECNGI